MRQVRLAIVAGVGVVVLCGIALVSSLCDYVAHPEVANAHVPPVVGTPFPSPSAPGPAAPAPIITAPVETPSPSAQPAGRGDLASFIQQLEEHRHRVPHRG